MIMSKNILLIVEGNVDEQDIFSKIFLKYGFNTIISKEKLNLENIGQFDKYEYSSNKENVVIIQGPRTRIHDFLLLIQDPNISIEKIFKYSYAYFQNIFLIYDVDHNDCDDIEKMYNQFQDESTGMLLLSSPCIEVIADYKRDRKEEKYYHLGEYKKQINEFYNGQTKKYIVDNFENIMLYFLDKNFNDFKEPNIMEHPRLVVQMINKYNDRVNKQNKNDSYVIYRYFSTVIYVAIAAANSLTKEINNYLTVKNFFLNQNS